MGRLTLEKQESIIRTYLRNKSFTKTAEAEEVDQRTVSNLIKRYRQATIAAARSSGETDFSHTGGNGLISGKKKRKDRRTIARKEADGVMMMSPPQSVSASATDTKAGVYPIAASNQEYGGQMEAPYNLGDATTEQQQPPPQQQEGEETNAVTTNEDDNEGIATAAPPVTANDLE